MESQAAEKRTVEALAAGDPAAFAALYARLGRRMYRVAAAIVGTASDAEDVVHDVFVSLARGRERLRLVEDLDAYVFASLRRATVTRITRARNEKRRLEHLALTVPTTSEPGEPEEGDEIAAALAGLPAEQREVVSLKLEGELTFAQIAVVLGIRPNTAASRYRYAIEKLRKWIEERA